MQKTRQKVRWNDLSSATPAELKKTYRLSDRQLEVQVRSHLDGSGAADRRRIYQEVYGKRK